jgi:hypothetical protein
VPNSLAGPMCLNLPRRLRKHTKRRTPCGYWRDEKEYERLDAYGHDENPDDYQQCSRQNIDDGSNEFPERANVDLALQLCDRGVKWLQFPSDRFPTYGELLLRLARGALCSPDVECRTGCRLVPSLTVLVNTMYYPPIFNCFVKEPRRWGLRPNDSSNTCR